MGRRIPPSALAARFIPAAPARRRPNFLVGWSNFTRSRSFSRLGLRVFRPRAPLAATRLESLHLLANVASLVGWSNFTRSRSFSRLGLHVFRPRAPLGATPARIPRSRSFSRPGPHVFSHIPTRLQLIYNRLARREWERIPASQPLRTLKSQLVKVMSGRRSGGGFANGVAALCDICANLGLASRSDSRRALRDAVQSNRPACPWTENLLRERAGQKGLRKRKQKKR